jgi:hypothetical protein
MTGHVLEDHPLSRWIGSAGPGRVKSAVQAHCPRLTEQAGGPVRSYAALMSLFRRADGRYSR